MAAPAAGFRVERGQRSLELVGVLGGAVRVAHARSDLAEDPVEQVVGHRRIMADRRLQ